MKRLLLDDVGLLHKTIGILFIATPHRGSPFAHYARFAVRPADDVVMLSLQNETNKKVSICYFFKLLRCCSWPLAWGIRMKTFLGHRL